MIVNSTGETNMEEQNTTPGLKYQTYTNATCRISIYNDQPVLLKDAKEGAISSVIDELIVSEVPNMDEIFTQLKALLDIDEHDFKDLVVGQKLLELGINKMLTKQESVLSVLATHNKKVPIPKIQKIIALFENV